MEFLDDEEEASFNERAAIAEYDGGMARENAEALAYLEMMARRLRDQ